MQNVVMNEPVRKIIRRGHGSVIGRFQSAKSLQPLPYESTHERDFLYRMEADPDVIGIHAQPQILRWNDAGIVRTHIPDFLVIRADCEMFVEIKPLDLVQEPLFQRRAAIIDADQRARGRSYEMRSEDWIRAEPAFGNAKILLNGRGQMLRESTRMRVLACLTDNPRSFAEIIKMLGQKPFFVNALYALILSGDLELVSPNIRLTRTSLVQTRRN